MYKVKEKAVSTPRLPMLMVLSDLFFKIGNLFYEKIQLGNMIFFLIIYVYVINICM